MDFIREKIKEKPANKKRIAANIGVSVLCGLVFAGTVCVALLFLLPHVKETESILDDTQKQSENTSQELQIETENFIIPSDMNLSISDYQILQNELYNIGNEINKSIVTIKSNNDWTENSYEAKEQGAGIIIGADNYYLYILTERKSISDIENIHVMFIDQMKADAVILGQDGNTGIVVLAVENRQLKDTTKRNIEVATLGSSYDIENGTVVIALGSPLGTGYSILTGNITSIDNEITTKDKNYSIFTTDIIGSEHSSGVLINVRGEVIGMIMQSFGNSKEGGTLTAVQIMEIISIIEQLKDRKNIPYIGLYISTVTESISKEYDIPKGVFIKEVAADSPAMKAGLQSGDIITKINGETVRTDIGYSEKVSRLIPGTICEISVKRQNGNEYYDVTCLVNVGVLE